MNDFLWGIVVAILSIFGVGAVLYKENRKTKDAIKKARDLEYELSRTEAERKSKSDPLAVVIDRVADNLDRSKR